MYADDGPAEQSVSSPADDVEGWMFQLDEPDNPTAPAPAVTPSYSQICNASTEVPPPSLITCPRNHDEHERDGSGVGDADDRQDERRAGAGCHHQHRSEHEVEVERCREHHDNGRGIGHDDHDARRRWAGRDRGGTRNQGSSDGHRPAVASAPSHGSSGGGSSGNLLPVILVAVVVAALGGFALVRWRRRPAEE